MSNDGTRQLGEGRIPSCLIDTYVQYKRDTRAVIAWLVSHGTSKYKGLSALSLQDLFGLAEIVRTKAVEMPGTIKFQFREAIAARTLLSKWHRRVHDHHGIEDQNTCNHEHFTTCLTEIYNDLCKCCAKPQDKRRRAHQRKTTHDSTQTPLNRFTTLELCHDSKGTEVDAFSERLEPNVGEIKSRLSDPPLPRLLDDTLGEAFELRKEIQEMHDLLTTTQYTWEQAAQGATSVVAATLITHLAFAEFEEIENRLKDSCGVPDPGMLLSKYTQMRKGLGLQTAEEKDLKSSPKQMIDSLQENWLGLVQMKLDGPQPSLVQGRSCSTLGPGSDSDLKHGEHVATILEDMRQHMQSGILNNSVVRIGSPVLDEIGFFLTCGESDGNSLRCSFGLQLLLQSCKTYCFSSPPPAMPAACRLQALKFAQRAIISIEAVLEDSTMPCKCPDTLACHLDMLLADFRSFLQTRIFDLYFQSPWVSGSHVVEMLDALLCHGLRLFNYRMYISSILHAYNILRQFTSLRPIPLFDRLVEGALGEVIFPGGRPVRNFKACHNRSIGGRLRFDSRKHRDHHNSDSHSIAVPAHAAMATAGFSIPKCTADTDHRFKFEKISLLHSIKSRGYHPTKANWRRVHELGNAQQKESQKSRSPKHGAKGTCPHNTRYKDDSTCPSERLRAFEKVVQAELAGPFPVAAINFFAIYLVCIDVISAISDKHHAIADPGKKCICFVGDLLRAADRCRDNEKHTFGQKELVEMCTEAFEEKLVGKDLEDFLWKGL